MATRKPSLGRKLIPIADTHNGHFAGLTPPAWWWPDNDTVPPWKRAWARIQRELWENYVATAERIGPGGVVVGVGDLIEGRGERTRGTELLTGRLDEQAEMAVETIRVWQPSRVVLFRGTSYHVSDGEDIEDQIAKEFNCEIYDHACLDFEGILFDIRHHVARSSVPHGRATPVAREWLTNVLMSAREEAPKADVILRAHTHSFVAVEFATGLAMALPALQASGSKFGVRVVTGTVDWGVVEFWREGDEIRWRKHLKAIHANRLTTLKV